MSPFLTRKLLYWSMFLEEMPESLLCYRSPWWLGYLYFGCLYKQPEAKEGYNLMRKWRCLNYRWLLGMPQLKKNNSLSIFLFTPGLNKLTKKKINITWQAETSLYLMMKYTLFTIYSSLYCQDQLWFRLPNMKHAKQGKKNWFYSNVKKLNLL